MSAWKQVTPPSLTRHFPTLTAVHLRRVFCGLLFGCLLVSACPPADVVADVRITADKRVLNLWSFDDGQIPPTWRIQGKGISVVPDYQGKTHVLRLDSARAKATQTVTIRVPSNKSLAVAFDFYDDAKDGQCFGLYLDATEDWKKVVGLTVNTQFAKDCYLFRGMRRREKNILARSKGWHQGVFLVEKNGVNAYVDGICVGSSRDFPQVKRIVISSAGVRAFASTNHLDNLVLITPDTESGLAAAGIEGITYRVNTPAHEGDTTRPILTDGVASAQNQLTWKGLRGVGTVTINLDLGKTWLVTALDLIAFAQPAANISAVEVFTSLDGERWVPAFVINNESTDTQFGKQVLAGRCAHIARFLRLHLRRPRTDHDVTLSEVSVSGREPNAVDRILAMRQAQYHLGPRLPVPKPQGQADANYWYLDNGRARFAIHKKTGVIAGAWSRPGPTRCIARVVDKYVLMVRAKDTHGDEYGDRVIAVAHAGPRELRIECKNAELGIQIRKNYKLSKENRLAKEVSFAPKATAESSFVIYSSQVHLPRFYLETGKATGGDYFGPLVRLSGIGSRLKVYPNRWRAFINEGAGVSLAQYRYKVDGHFVLPWSAHWAEEANHSFLTATGWQLPLFVAQLGENQVNSAEVHYVLFRGDRFDFHRLYTALPEPRRLYRERKRPAWVSDVKALVSRSGYCDPFPIVKDVLAKSDEGHVMYTFFDLFAVWGDYFSTPGQSTYTRSGLRITTDKLKEMVDRLHQLSPRMKVSLYTFPWAAYEQAEVLRQHPEWFITEDRRGKPLNCYPEGDFGCNHAWSMAAAGVKEYRLTQYEGLVKNLGLDFVYIDGGCGAMSQIDWKHGRVDKPYTWDQFIEDVRMRVRGHGKDKALFFNNAYTPACDCGFRELQHIDKMAVANWRDLADKMFTIKLFQKGDTRWAAPLYWRAAIGKHTPYTNYILGLGLKPHDNNNVSSFFYLWTAAFEVKDIEIVDAGISPDWRKEPTELEAYCLKQGDNTSIITVMSHHKAPENTELSVNAKAVGLEKHKPVFVWEFDPVMPCLENDNENEQATTYRETKCGGASLIKASFSGKRTIDGKRFMHSTSLSPGNLKMVMLTHSPAVLWSVNGRRNHFWLPDTRGVSVNGEFESQAHRVRAHVDCGRRRASEILLYWPKTWKLVDVKTNGSPVKPEFVNVSGSTFILVPVVGKGPHRVVASGRPSAVGPLFKSGTVKVSPRQPIAGESMRLRGKLAVRGKGALVLQITDSQGLLVYVSEKKIDREGRITERVRLPKALKPGTYTASLNDPYSDAEITTSFQLKNPAWQPPPKSRLERITRHKQPKIRKGPFQSRGFTIGAIGTTRRIRDRYALFDLKELSFENHLGRVSYWGETSVGIEFRGLQTVVLEVLTEDYKRVANNAFAGAVIDYRTEKGYTKRVAVNFTDKGKDSTDGILWGKGLATKDQFVDLSHQVTKGRPSRVELDLTSYAPPGWDGNVWFTSSLCNVGVARNFHMRIVDWSPRK